MPDQRYAVGDGTHHSFHPVSFAYLPPSLASEHEEDNSESSMTGRDRMHIPDMEYTKGRRGREEGRDGGREEGKRRGNCYIIPRCCHDLNDKLVLRISNCLL